MTINRFMLLITITLLNVHGNFANQTEETHTNLLSNSTQLHQSLLQSNESVLSKNTEYNNTIVYVYPQTTTTTKNYKDVVIVYPDPTPIIPIENAPMVVESINQINATITAKPVENDLIIESGNQSLNENLVDRKNEVQMKMVKSTMISNDTEEVKIVNEEKSDNSSNISTDNATNIAKRMRENLIKRLALRNKTVINKKYLKINNPEPNNDTSAMDNDHDVDNKTESVIENKKNIVFSNNTSNANNTNTEHDLVGAESVDNPTLAFSPPPNRSNGQIQRNVEMVSFTLEDAVIPNKKNHIDHFDRSFVKANNFKSYTKNEKMSNEKLAMQKKPIYPKKYSNEHILKKLHYPETYYMSKNDNSDNVKLVQNLSQSNRLSIWSGYVKSGEPISKTSNMNPQLRQRNDASFLQIDPSLRKDLLIVGLIPKPLPVF